MKIDEVSVRRVAQGGRHVQPLAQVAVDAGAEARRLQEQRRSDGGNRGQRGHMEEGEADEEHGMSRAAPLIPLNIATPAITTQAGSMNQ